MIRGLNQSMAWVIAFVMAMTVFAAIGFLLMAVKAKNSDGDVKKAPIHASKEVHETHESEEATPNVLRATPPSGAKEGERSHAASGAAQDEGQESQGGAFNQQGEEEHKQAKPALEDQHSDAADREHHEKPGALKDSKKKIRSF